MCNMNHSMLTFQSIATSELGSRAILFSRDVGLSAEQVAAIADVARDWRVRYRGYAEQVVELGNRIDALLNERSIDVDTIKKLAAERRDLIARAEDEYVDVWKSLAEMLDGRQYDGLQRVYRAEFEKLPHPILGTTGHSSPLGEQAPSLA